MRFSFALIVLSAAFASASAATLKARQYPDCANPCIANADLDGCDADDNSCLCHSSVFVNSVTSCIQSACSGSDLATAENDADELCAAVGVNLSSVTSAASSTPSGSSTAPAPSSTAPSSPAPSPSNTSSSSGSAPSSSASGSNTAPPPAQTSNGAVSNGINALAGLAAIGVVALAL